MKRGIALVILAAAACGPDKKSGPIGPGSGTGSGTDLAVATIDAGPMPAPDAEPIAELPLPLPKVDHLPEVFAPPWKTVGVGQKISFGVAAIDQDLDETRTEVTSMPASATFDALTQTVSWKPTKADLKAGKGTFVIKVSNLDGNGEATRSQEYTWELAVAKKAQPTPDPIRQSTAFETVFTIREAGRLAAVNKAWPFDKFLARSAELARAQLAPEQQAKLGKLDKKALFQGFLAGMAVTHGNPRIDPKASGFQKKVFGDPSAWKIVTVRPRIDKKWNELRVVFQAVNAPEPVFAMFRIRPTWDVATLPPEARGYNNKVFEDMVWRHLLDEGKPSEKHFKNQKAHGKAVAALVDELMAFDDSATNPWARAAFLALPTEARLGGGSLRNADGSYRSGDGWAWSVMKPNVTADGAAQAYVSIGIPGFWTATAPSPDGKSWVGKCAPRFDPDDPKHEPGYEVLCRKDKGFVDLPATVDGKIATSKHDAVNQFVEYKTVDMVASLALEDGRRDSGEENGMTCSQCHIRNFGVRDYGDAATVDPNAGVPGAPNHAISTLNFQIIPTTEWQDYTLEFMADQECKAAAQFPQFLGKDTGFVCALKP